MEARIGPLEPGDPRRISSFTVDGVLGHGGMGRVYLAHTPEGRKVAVKVVHEALAREPEFIQRFRREIEAARSIPELYTAGFVDADPDARRPWLATTFIDGPTLQHQVERDGPLKREQVLRLVRSTANALAAIHGRWVHRDLKPSNIVVDAFGTPHIIDFGIIARAVEQTRITQKGHVYGTRGYMSPEQRRGERIGPATDVYALGMTAFFAATATGPTDDVAGSDLGLVTDPDVAELVRACTVAEAAQRPTAREVAARADALLGGGSTQQPITEPPDPRPSPPPPRRRGTLVAGGAVLVLLAVAGAFAPQWWSSGRAATAGGCATLPSNGVRTFVAEASDGQCYGVTDAARDGDGAESGFGRDPAARRLQAQLFGANRLNPPTSPNDLTVIFFGALTCPAYRPDGITCVDGREYDAERQELQALHLAQQRGDLGGHVRVVVANAGSDMRYAREAARLVVEHRAAFGRAVAVGGGDSRVGTKEAFRSLVDAGIPFIAPNLSSDDEGPGLPFIDAPGFLQLQRPNQAYARALVSFIARHSGSADRQVIIYRTDDPADLYTSSLARDVQFEARSNPGTDDRPARVIGTLDDVPASVCRRAGSGSTGDALPPALVFADRWSTFGALAARLTSLCGDDGPAMLVGDDSVSRFMTNDTARTAVRAPWPLAYVSKGVQCSEVETAARRDPSNEASKLLRVVRGSLSLCDPATGSQQMGYNVALYWDAVALGQRVLPAGGAGALRDTTLAGANASMTVRDGRVVWEQAVSPWILCVLTVDRSGDGGRSVANCDKAFAGR